MSVALQNGEATPSGIESLLGLDWDFASDKTNGLSHSLHPYPAKFIPQIPAALIGALSRPGELVCDVFCGSGTTLVEALRLGRNALGIDANPLACLITRAKTQRLTRRACDELLLLARDIRALGSSIAGTSPLFAPRTPFRSDAPRPDSDALRFWFEDHVIEELAEILARCNAASAEARPLALTSFSAIVVTVSRQDSDTRYVRREKNVQPGDSLHRFAKVLEANVAAAMSFAEAVSGDVSAEVVAANILDRPPLPRFDLLVCSPPYPNAYSYHLYHRTRMLWLGMDQAGFKRAEIGSHRKYSSRGANAANAETFQRELEQIFAHLATLLREERYACFVVGNSTIRGEQVDNATLIRDAGAQHGFVEVARFTRRLRDTKKAFNPSIGRIKTEAVLILQNRGRT